jgi:hypothetical protein
MDEPVTPSDLHNKEQSSVIILVEIKSCHATNKTGDAFSEVLNGVIQLSGFLSKMKLKEVSVPEFGTQWSASPSGKWLEHADILGRPRVTFDHDPPGPQEMFCLPILLHFDSHFWYLECLILVAVEGRKDTYERFGRLTISVQDLTAVIPRSKLRGGKSDFELEDADNRYELRRRRSAWGRFIRFWSEHAATSTSPNNSLEFKTITVPEAIEISIE